jgi:hypothetical protein
MMNDEVKKRRSAAGKTRNEDFLRAGFIIHNSSFII